MRAWLLDVEEDNVHDRQEEVRESRVAADNFPTGHILYRVLFQVLYRVLFQILCRILCRVLCRIQAHAPVAEERKVGDQDQDSSAATDSAGVAAAARGDTPQSAVHHVLRALGRPRPLHRLGLSRLPGARVHPMEGGAPKSQGPVRSLLRLASRGGGFVVAVPHVANPAACDGLANPAACDGLVNLAACDGLANPAACDGLYAFGAGLFRIVAGRFRLSDPGDLAWGPWDISGVGHGRRRGNPVERRRRHNPRHRLGEK